MTKIILITGACGYLGSITTKALHQHKNVKIIALDIRKPQQELNDVVYEISDICSPENIQKVFEKYSVDIVVHLAAIIPGKKSNPELEYKVDVIGTKNILDACVKHNVSKIIISSSGAAYGYHADNPEWIKETDPVRGNDSFPYSKHKRLVEEMLLEYRQNHPQLKQVVFRIGTILGKNVNNQLAALFERKRVIAIKGSDSRFVFIWDEDVCGAILHGIFSDREGIFNVAGDGALSIYEIATILKKKTLTFPAGILKFLLATLHKIGLSPYGPEKIIFLQYRPVLDNHQLKTVFGYIPKKTSQEVFLHYIKEKKLVK